MATASKGIETLGMTDMCVMDEIVQKNVSDRSVWQDSRICVGEYVIPIRVARTYTLCRMMTVSLISVDWLSG